ncbi:MAG: hypothetical protein FD123_914 [Bacteroidetes bacterium]|nr:MAG: hypothetical protein FD123_914 [Bacteroidota bacterium]
MVLVYTHKITNRLRYIFHLYFDEMLGVPVHFTTDQNEFAAHAGPKLSYGQKPLANELHFASCGLLFETGISEQHIPVSLWEDLPVFFSAGKQSALPFDLFAAGFYLVSRYEEYLPHIRDSLDRFDAHQSLAWQNGFLQKPVVNLWGARLKKILAAHFPALTFPVKRYRFVPTIDIDNAYAYREKGIVRAAGGLGKALFQLNFSEFSERLRVLLRLQKDPYDTYDYQLQVQEQFHFRPVYFFLVGDYGVNDKNLSVQNRKFRSLIKHIADHAEIGVHPSFGSNKEPERLRTEISRLRSILHQDITRSRQHFLMLKFPDTYRNLIERDITDDFSMGFANEIGFRAGICTSFKFYDLDQELETGLRIHPFAVMDASLKYYMKTEPEAAPALVAPLIEEVKSVQGVFMLLWHNESLSDEKQWKGWRDTYFRIVTQASEKKQA